MRRSGGGPQARHLGAAGRLAAQCLSAPLSPVPMDPEEAQRALERLRGAAAARELSGHAATSEFSAGVLEQLQHLEGCTRSLRQQLWAA